MATPVACDNGLIIVSNVTLAREKEKNVRESGGSFLKAGDRENCCGFDATKSVIIRADTATAQNKGRINMLNRVIL